MLDPKGGLGWMSSLIPVVVVGSLLFGPWLLAWCHIQSLSLSAIVCMYATDLRLLECCNRHNSSLLYKHSLPITRLLPRLIFFPFKGRLPFVSQIKHHPDSILYLTPTPTHSLHPLYTMSNQSQSQTQPTTAPLQNSTGMSSYPEIYYTTIKQLMF